MNCNELREHYELYAIGVAEEPERSEIRAHLNRECEVCMRGIKRARELVALLGGTAPPAAPSAALRRRILASAGVEQRRFGWAPFLAAALALALFAAVYFGGRERDLANELARVREQSSRQTIELPASIRPSRFSPARTPRSLPLAKANPSPRARYSSVRRRACC